MKPPRDVQSIERDEYLSLVLSRSKLVSEREPTSREIYEPETGKRFVIDDSKLFPPTLPASKTA